MAEQIKTAIVPSAQPVVKGPRPKFSNTGGFHKLIQPQGEQFPSSRVPQPEPRR